MAARLRDIRRVAQDYGIEVTEPSSGSHWEARRKGCRMYTIPAHNGLKTQVDDIYISGLCRHFGLDKDEFREKL